MADKKQTIWLVGGGTGGHIVPLLAVADELKHDYALTYIGARKSLEATLAHEAGLPFVAIAAGKLRRYVSIGAVLLNIRDSYRIAKGVVRSYFLIKKRKPALIFSKGGPVALPIALAAWMTDTPLITHESDAVMGFANRFMARFARVVCTAFPASFYPAVYAKKIVTTGLPIRKEFCFANGSHKSHDRKPSIVIMGGSQGAVAINEQVALILPRLLTIASVVHITGEYSYKKFEALKKSLSPDEQAGYTVLAFTPDIARYVRAATLVVSRSSSSIFEIASLHKPMLLIPLPSAANNHQLKNAEIFSQFRAAIVIRQERLTPYLFYEKIENILLDKKLQQELKEGTRTFSSCGSAKKVAALLKQYAG